MSDKNYGLIALEIGVKDMLTEANARKAAGALILARMHYPDSPLMFMIGGYDEDSRELWEIPETREYIRAWARLAGIDDWRRAIEVKWVDGEPLAILQACGTFAADSPINVKFTSRRPRKPGAEPLGLPPDQTDSTGRELPPVRCPDCNYLLDAASHPTEPATRPSPGDMTVCFECTTFLEYRADMTLQVASPADVRNLPADIRDELFAVRRAIQEFKKADAP